MYESKSEFCCCTAFLSSVDDWRHGFFFNFFVAVSAGACRGRDRRSSLCLARPHPPFLSVPRWKFIHLSGRQESSPSRPSAPRSCHISRYVLFNKDPSSNPLKTDFCLRSLEMWTWFHKKKIISFSFCDFRGKKLWLISPTRKLSDKEKLVSFFFSSSFWFSAHKLLDCAAKIDFVFFLVKFIVFPITLSWTLPFFLSAFLLLLGLFCLLSIGRTKFVVQSGPVEFILTNSTGPDFSWI